VAVHFQRSETSGDSGLSPKPGIYAWIAFVLIFGLMLSDYLSRQVMNAVFPLLKIEWGLSDTQLGALVSVVALTVGVMAFPVSLVADRVGRVKAATAMAIVWGLATVTCGLSGNFLMMFIARAFVGLGEAGYGSAGAAILVHIFPPRMHAMVIGSFLAAALFGSVLGVVLGGLIAQQLGWPMAFIIVGAGGLVLAVVFPMVVREPAVTRAENQGPMPLRLVWRELFASRTAICTYIGSGLLMFIQGSFVAWMPSYLNRYLGMESAQAALGAGVMILVAGVGMIGGGALVDRMSLKDKRNRLRLPALYALGAALVLSLAFAVAPGLSQLVLIGLGLMIGAGFSGAAGAVVADVTHASIHATVFATLTLANNLLGLAPGPLLTGWVADYASLQTALQLVPLTGVLAAVAYSVGARSYVADRARLHGSGGA
jgi:MFS family permease